MGTRLDAPRRRRRDGNGAAQLLGRYQLIARALRALGRPVPENVNDDDVIVLIPMKEN